MATNNLGNNLESWTVYTGNPITGNTGLTVSTTSATYAYAMLSNVTTSTVTGRPNVDFVWGNFPLQPNDERSSGTPSATVTVGGSQNVQWTNTSTVNSAYLDYTKDTQNIAEANYSGFPSFIAGDPVLRVTAASGNGTTVTYTAQSNGINPASLVGQNVTITGLTASAFNLTNATIASATAYQFTVTNSAGSGVSITGQYGVAQLGAGASDSDGSFVGGVAYVTVPSVIGQTTANATTILTDLELAPTTASSYTPAISAVNLTTNVATATTAAAHGFAVGDTVVIAGLSTTALNGSHVLITGTTGSTLKWAQTHADISGTSDSGTAKVAARAGTIYSQSVAAGAASVAAGAAITITPYAA
jgi:hypothetical protein